MRTDLSCRGDEDHDWTPDTVAGTGTEGPFGSGVVIGTWIIGSPNLEFISL